jgi:LL-diaminopimelate aminotransferase
MKLSKRLDRIPPYLFAEIDKKVAEAKAQGHDVISLGIGDPDTPTFPNVVAEMRKAIDDPSTHNYPPYQGTLEFRQACAKWMKKRFDVELDADSETLALIGSKEGIAHAFLAFVDPGDLVLVPDPGYPVYQNGTILAGGEYHLMPMTPENNFLPDLDAIPEDVAKKAKIMWLNYPNNPTGAVATLEYFEKVVEFAKKYDILVCHDQAYCEMTYDGYIAPSILQVKGAKDIAIEFFSHSKSYNMTGWRAGFAVGNAQAIQALGTIKNNIDSGIFKAVQKAAVEAFNTPQQEIDKLNEMYKKRRDIVVQGLREMGWNIEAPKATFYLWLPVPKGMSSVEFVGMMLEKAHIVVPPGNGYGENGEGFFRIALTVDENRLIEAVERMKKAGISYQSAAKV